MPKFRKKPVVIEAELFSEENKHRAFHFVNCNCSADWDSKGDPILKIQNFKGIMTASLGDWIIRGVAGEFYPCKPDIFEATYEPVKED